MDTSPAGKVIEILEDRMVALIDLQLTLKHIHWNVVGPNFIGVHEMLDPQVDAVREMTDTIAERIATLGGIPVGTAGAVAERRTWKDYSLHKARVAEHLGALDVVYSGVNSDHRAAIARLAELDPVSEDIIVGELAELEQFQWFVRAHLESTAGELPTAGIHSEKAGARHRTPQRCNRCGKARSRHRAGHGPRHLVQHPGWRQCAQPGCGGLSPQNRTGRTHDHRGKARRGLQNFSS